LLDCWSLAAPLPSSTGGWDEATMTESNHDPASTHLAVVGDPSGDVAVAVAHAVAAAAGYSRDGHGPSVVGHQRASAVIAQPGGNRGRFGGPQPVHAG